MQIGIQSNCWRNDYHTNDLRRLLKEASLAGYSSVEVGAHRIGDWKDYARLLESIEENTAGIIGLHILGDFFYQDALRGIYDYPHAAAQLAANINAKYLLVSGNPDNYSTYTDYESFGRVLDAIGGYCRSVGVRCCYHNHWWELENERTGLNKLMAATDPENVSLAMDVGWINRAGLNPAECMNMYLERLGYVHLKDDAGDKWTEIGKGSVNFFEIADVLLKNENICAVVEREEPLDNALESARTSRDYLRRLGL